MVRSLDMGVATSRETQSGFSCRFRYWLASVHSSKVYGFLFLPLFLSLEIKRVRIVDEAQNDTLFPNLGKCQEGNIFVG